MITTAVSKLKASLSELLSHVKAGGELLVTERGRPIARIVPFRRTGASLEPDLMELQRAGLSSPPGRRLSASFWSMPRPQDPRGEAVKALLEERAAGR